MPKEMSFSPSLGSASLGSWFHSQGSSLQAEENVVPISCQLTTCWGRFTSTAFFCFIFFFSHFCHLCLLLYFRFSFMFFQFCLNFWDFFPLLFPEFCQLMIIISFCGPSSVLFLLLCIPSLRWLLNFFFLHARMIWIQFSSFVLTF